MDAQTFLDNFATIADAPEGVQRLRRLVLDLAVSGRLVKRDPGEGSAGVLLSESAAEREKLFLRGLVPKRRAAAAASEGPPPFDVPDSWSWSHLDSVAVYIQRGKSPRYSPVPTSVPVVSQKCVQWSGFDLGLARHVLEESLTGYGPERFLQPGDLLWNSTGTGTVGRVAVVPDRLTTERVVADSHITVVRLARCRPRYVAAWLSSTFVQSRIDQLTSGTTQQQELNTSTVRHLGLPLPPLLEQERIVAKVDELMGLCDELEARQQPRERAIARFQASALHALTEAGSPDDILRAWGRLSTNWPALTVSPDSIPAIRQAVLRLAVQGCLVAQDSNDEPAESLLNQLAKRRRSPAVPLPPRDRRDLPAGWSWASFGQATVNRDSERIPLKRGDRARRRGEYDYYGASGVIDSIDDYIFDGDLLLIGEDGANLVFRSTPIAFIASGRFWVNNHAHVLDSVDLAALKYLAIFINSIDLRPFLTGIAQPKLNQTRMNRIPVPLPPLAEQGRIVERVEQILAVCEELQWSLTNRQVTQLAFAATACRAAVA